MCQPQSYDLALIKQLSGTQTTFVSGDSVTFNITVFNQGAIPAMNVIITDYIPTGLTLNDTAWTLSGALATYNTPLSIATGSSQIISITFIVNGTLT